MRESGLLKEPSTCTTPTRGSLGRHDAERGSEGVAGRTGRSWRRTGPRSTNESGTPVLVVQVRTDAGTLGLSNTDLRGGGHAGDTIGAEATDGCFAHAFQD